jgi:hypothetical protein
MLSEALLGSALGGALRLAPEWLKYLDARNERAHELEMQKLVVANPVAAGEGGPVVTAGDIEALKAVYVERSAARAAKRYPWIDVPAALVRPVVTGWLVALYSFVRLTELSLGLRTYGADDLAIFSGVLSFWFISRVWDKR